MPVAFGRGGRVSEAAGGRDADSEAAGGGGVAVGGGEVDASGGEGGADPDCPLRLQCPDWTRSSKKEEKRKTWGNKISAHFPFHYRSEIISWVKGSVCLVLKFALPPFYPPLPSGVQISKQNTH